LERPLVFPEDTMEFALQIPSLLGKIFDFSKGNHGVRGERL